MFHSLRILTLTFGVILVSTQLAAAQREYPLMRVAAQSGYTYSWLSSERAVSLSRPGIVIVIRPGDQIYEVNDRIETTSIAPRYASNDILVSEALARRINELARVASGSASLGSGGIPLTITTTPVQGSITLAVRPVPGSEALDISGTAPASVPVTLTLLATVSSDIPTVVVSRHDLQTDRSGHFQTTVSIAPDYLRGSILQVSATSVPGVSSATVQIIPGAPNAAVSVPVERYP